MKNSLINRLFKHREVRRLEKEYDLMKKKAAKTQMNNHFVFNSLNAIQHFITVNEKELSLKYLSMFGKLIRYTLDSIGQESVEVGRELEMLEVYFKLQKLRYGEKFNYDYEIENINVCNNCLIPAHIMGGLFENVLENEIMHHSQPIHLFIKIKVLEKGIRVEIRYDADKELLLRENDSYRKRFLNWEEQVNLINKIKNVNIGTDSLIRVETKKESYLATIMLYIPSHLNEQ